MRLDKFLSHAGLGTRREVHLLLRDSRIFVDGVVEKDGKKKIAPANQITCDEKKVEIPGPVVIAFNKPAGLVTSTSDPQATIYSVLPFDPKKIKPIGRLDKDTEGLLLLTDDGKLNHALCSPRHHVEKEYVAKLDGEIINSALDCLRSPLSLENGEKVRGAIRAEKVDKKTIRLVIDEGKYHQVRRMCAVVGYRVMKLTRTRIDFIELGKLEIGSHRIINESEYARLLQTTQRKNKSEGQT